MTIHLIQTKATPQQISEMLTTLEDFIKVAVDVRREILAGGGALHADCEEVLLEAGSAQDDVWGANWYPADHRAECEAVMNIRPWQNNPSMQILDSQLCEQVCKITQWLLDVT
jgi:uncharacterized protein DUF5674